MANIRLIDILLGVITGFLFLYNFILYQQNIKINGLSISVGIMRISLIIPILVSLFIFSENISLLNYIGIVIIISSFMLITKTSLKLNLLFLFLLFIITGIQESMLKIYDVVGLSEKGAFILFVFSSAFLFNLLWNVIKKQKMEVRSLLYGFILGIPNMLTTKFLMEGLVTVPGAIAFPFVASSVVVLVFLSDIFIWKKEFSLKQKISFILLILGITFLNLQV